MGKLSVLRGLGGKGYRVAQLGQGLPQRAQRAQRAGQRRTEGELGKWESLVF
jgi:hypothetical protein